MRTSYAICCALFFALPMLASCDRMAADDAAAPAAVATSSLPASEDATMHYVCDRGVQVSILRTGKVDAHMPDGTVAHLSLIADSSPSVYTGAGLYFRIGQEGAFLSQEEGSEEVACLPE